MQIKFRPCSVKFTDKKYKRDHYKWDTAGTFQSRKWSCDGGRGGSPGNKENSVTQK